MYETLVDVGMVGLAKDVDFSDSNKKTMLHCCTPLFQSSCSHISSWLPPKNIYTSTFNFHHISMTLRDPIYTPYHRMMEQVVGFSCWFLPRLRSSHLKQLLRLLRLRGDVESWIRLPEGLGEGWVEIHGLFFFWKVRMVVGCCFLGGGWGFNFAERDSIPIFFDSFLYEFVCSCRRLLFVVVEVKVGFCRLVVLISHFFFCLVMFLFHWGLDNCSSEGSAVCSFPGSLEVCLWWKACKTNSWHLRFQSAAHDLLWMPCKYWHGFRL